MGVGTKIKTILKEQKKTIKQLAEESGVPLNTLYSITKRDSTAVTYPVLEKVSKALGVPIESLLADDSRKEALDMAAYLTELFTKDYNDPSSKDYHSPRLEKLMSYNYNLEAQIESQIEQLPFDQEIRAQETADEAFVSGMSGLPDSYIKRQVLEIFSSLNRRGKIEAMLRLNELSENQRFRDSPRYEDSDLDEDEDSEEG